MTIGHTDNVHSTNQRPERAIVRDPRLHRRCRHFRRPTRRTEQVREYYTFCFFILHTRNLL